MTFYIILSFFLVSFIFIGVMNRKRSRSPVSFFLGNRKGSTLLITGSLVSTIIGGSSTLGLAGLAYARGLTAAWWLFSGSIGLVILALVFVKRIREHDAVTLPELLEFQYRSRALGVTASLLIIFSWTGIIAGQIIAAGRILGALNLSSFNGILIAIGLVIIIYTALGGQYSILKTDFLQSLVIITGIGITLFFCMEAVSFTKGVEKLPKDFFHFPLSEKFLPGDLLYYLFFIGMSYLIGPDMFSRVFSAADAPTARRSLLLAALILVPLALLIAAAGMYARALYPSLASEQAFPELVVRLLPAGAGALVMAALLTALISSADTCLLTAGTIVTVNIIRPLTGMSSSDHRQVMVTRCAVVVIGTAALLIALYIQHIISTLLLAYMIFASSLAGTVLLGPFARRLGIRGAGALVSVAAGGVVALACKVTGNPKGASLAIPLSLGVLFLSRFIFSRDPEREEE